MSIEQMFQWDNGPLSLITLGLTRFTNHSPITQQPYRKRCLIIHSGTALVMGICPGTVAGVTKVGLKNLQNAVPPPLHFFE